MNKLPPIPVPKANLSPLQSFVKKIVGPKEFQTPADFDPITGFPFSGRRGTSERNLRRLLVVAETMTRRQKEYSLPDFVIAGGAVRDVVFGSPMNDVDVFVLTDDEDAATLYTGDDDVYDNTAASAYSGTKAFQVFTEIPDNHFLLNAAPYQIISRKDVTTPVDLVESFDYNLVKAWYDPKDGKFRFHDDFAYGAIHGKVFPRNRRSSHYVTYYATHSDKTFSFTSQ